MQNFNRCLCAAWALALLGSACTSDPQRVPPKANDPSSKTIVILMIGDGMGQGQKEIASAFRHGVTGRLFMDTLPVQGRIRTASASGITDSAASATALSTGALTYNGTVGLDREAHVVENLVEIAASQGLASGLVTTTTLSHATPAAFAAHVNSRSQTREIAAAMAEQSLDVILGGGRNDFSQDGDVIDEVKDAGFYVAYDRGQLQSAPTDKPLLGLFADSNLPYVIERGSTVPSLSDMSLAALARLETKPKGFFLMIEGGRIDHAGHANVAENVVHETLEFDDAVRNVHGWAKDRSDVVLIVTADHETGGLRMLRNNGVGEIPDVAWRWGKHTNSDVTLSGMGPGLESFHQTNRHHRDVFSAMAATLKNSSVEPPEAEFIPDGVLSEIGTAKWPLPGLSPDKSPRPSPVRSMQMSNNAFGITIGLSGSFHAVDESLTILLDTDYGLAQGIHEFKENLTDNKESIHRVLTEIRLPFITDPLWRADAAVVTIGGMDPMLEQELPNAGLLLFDSEERQAHYVRKNIAINFSDHALGDDAPANAGVECFIPWDRIYGTEVPAPDRKVAALAVITNRQGDTIKQVLPSAESDSSAPAPLVYTIR